MSNNFAFTPAIGLRDSSAYPTVPASEAALRDGLQKGMDQLRDFVNGMPDVASTPTRTTAALTYYVDNVNGNDANDGLAAGAGRALKTIQAAVNKVPQIVNHLVVIKLAAGTYNEDVLIIGWVGAGAFRIDAGTGTGDRANYVVNSVTVQRITFYSALSWFKVTTTTKSAVSVYQCAQVDVIGLDITTAAAGQHGVDVASANVKVDTCIISNRNAAIASTNAHIYSTANTGTGNVYGLDALTAGVIGKSGTQPAGTTAEITGGGGVIR